MSFSQSPAVFADRVKAAGLTEADLKSFTDAGIGTLNKFAFCSSYVPGGADEAPFQRSMQTALGREPTLGELASCRKLLHEAYSLVTTEMKQQLERSEEFESRKLTQPERNDRFVKQQKKLAGLSIKGPLEPSDALIDVFCGIYDSNRLRFIPWEKYTSKESELEQEHKKLHMFTLDNVGKLKVENKANEQVADTSTEMMLQYALQRRGLAMDQANLLCYKIHQQWVDRLLKHRIQNPPDGYAKVSFKQMLEADRKLFQELAENTRGGVQLKEDKRPLDEIFVTCMNAPEVMHMLQPLVMKGNMGAKEAPTASSSKQRSAPYPSRGKGGKGQGKSKGTRMPLQLLEGGCRPTTNQGDPICFGFNLGTCRNQVQKGRCEKGFHVCALPRCGKHHPFSSCPAKKQGQDANPGS